MTYLNQARGRGVPAVLVDGGDSLFSFATKQAPTASEEAQSARNARKILAAYDAMGYQAVAVGPTDLQLGAGRLLEMAKSVRFPLLCANLVDAKTAKPVFPPSTVLTAGRIRVGVYAVLSDRLNATYMERAIPGARIRDPVEATREVLADLRPRCDVVLALSHLDVDANEKILDLKLGIDAMVDPLSRNGTKALWVDGGYATARSGTLVLRIDGQGSRVGVCELYFAKAATRPSGYQGYDVPLDPHILPHPSLERYLEGKAISPTGSPTDPVSAAPGAGARPLEGFLGEEGCGSCHAEQLAFWKATRHASAFATIETSGDGEKGDCFVCHSYGYGVTFFEEKVPERFRGVQCESCHGWRPEHAEDPKANRLGAVVDARCWGCHNETITRARFVPTEVWARAACPVGGGTAAKEQGSKKAEGMGE